ncbi:MAG TPA: DUF4238 domain-containing protein [Longimicrobium sp.]|nr:DUF4238 domain-containing protein [Longimicrobium sp.]
MSSPKRQHWVPRMYLRAFALPETSGTEYPEVWCFGKEGGDPFRASIKHVSVQEHLYSPRSVQGTRSYEMEKRLSGLEGIVAPLWQAFAEDALDFENPSYRKIIALFIATLYLRNPNRLEYHKFTHQRIVEQLGRLPRDTGGNPNITEIIYQDRKVPVDPSDWGRFANLNDSEIQEMFVSAIHRNATSLAKTIISKRWSVLSADTASFITCDDPVVMVHPVRERFGFRSPGTSVHVPISPTRVLCLDDRFEQPANMYYLAKPASIPSINYLTWRNARNFMISSRHTDDVLIEILSYSQFLEDQSRGQT